MIDLVVRLIVPAERLPTRSSTFPEEVACVRTYVRMQSGVESEVNQRPAIDRVSIAIHRWSPHSVYRVHIAAIQRMQAAFASIMRPRPAPNRPRSTSCSCIAQPQQLDHSHTQEHTTLSVAWWTLLSLSPHAFMQFHPHQPWLGDD
jgi:hypothetical protein